MVYSGYAELYYRERPGLAERPFSEQMQMFLADGFCFGDAWKHYLEASGRYEVMEVVLNAEPAQRQWARERGVRYAEENWSEAILAAQLAEFKPDIWFCHAWLAPQQRLRLRRNCPSVHHVIGYDGALNHDPDGLAGCDSVLSCVRESAAFYTHHGMKGYWLPWGFDPRIGTRLKAAIPQIQAVFCGSIGLGDVPHFGRAELLDRLRSQVNLELYVRDLFGYGVELALRSSVWHRKYALAWKILSFYPSLRRLRSVNGGARYGLAMFQLLANSKVALNLHGDHVNTAANMRLFEATGVGTCLLTDWKHDLPAVFEPDQEVVAFRSPEERAEKLRYLLDHEIERQSIAAAGQKRCLRDHHIGNHILAFAEEVLAKL
jgi:hypothetical protein